MPLAEIMLFLLEGHTHRVENQIKCDIYSLREQLFMSYLGIVLSLFNTRNLIK